MSDLQKHIQEKLQDPEFRKAWEESEEEFQQMKKEIGLKVLKKLCNSGGDVFYKYGKDGLFILSPVKEAREENDQLQIDFSGGMLMIEKNFKIELKEKPEGKISDCKVCYEIFNAHGESLGYVYEDNLYKKPTF